MRVKRNELLSSDWGFGQSFLEGVGWGCLNRAMAHAQACVQLRTVLERKEKTSQAKSGSDKALVVPKGTCMIDSSISRHPWFRGEEGDPTKGQQSLGNSCHKLLSLRTLVFRKDSHWIMTYDITVSDQKGMFPLGEVSGVRGREKERM